MDERTAVLDTCVLLPPRLRDTLLDLADAELYAPRWSADSLAELHRNLVRHALLDADRSKRLITALQRAFPDATVHQTRHRRLLPQLENHPKDRHVLASAIASSSKCIVTFNLRDFPTAALAPYGIVARSPDDFLLEMLRRDPQFVVTLLRTQAIRYRSPAMTFAELLARLSVLVPRFVAQVTALTSS